MTIHYGVSLTRGEQAEACSYFRWGLREYAGVMGAPPQRLELASV